AIKKAFRRTALKSHPDKATDPTERAQMTEKFQLVQEAYETLSVAEERKSYDIYCLPRMSRGNE
ncbi:hypothetical protein KIPB_008072, partial [Kipferlia bialata]